MTKKTETLGSKTHAASAQFKSPVFFPLFAMAYVFKLPPTLTEEIMRYAVGYPRDRLRDVAAGIERIERFRHSVESSSSIVFKHLTTIVKWKVPSEEISWARGPLQWPVLTLFWVYRRGVEEPESWQILDRERQSCIRNSTWECDACEPLSLSAERSHF